MAVTLYKYDDVGAPQLTGEVGKVIAVLDACLVNGYGDKSPAGWTKEFTGTNKAVYRPPAGNRLYLRILNDNSTTDGFDYSSVGICRAVGYETMSDVDTGTGAFPLNTQMSGGTYLHTTYDRTSTARSWWLIADDKIFYFIPIYDTRCFGFCFGSFYSYVDNDNYNTVIVGNTNSGRTSVNLSYNFALGNVSGGTYAPRRWDQLSSSIQCSKLNISGLGVSNQHSGVAQVIVYPNPITGGLLLSGQYIQETALGTIIRGRLPGFWSACQNISFLSGQIFQGSPGTELEGKTLMFFSGYNGGGFFIETSDTWYDVGF